MTTTTRPRFTYIPGLDGIRGFWVVVGPLMYHARPDVIPGGILGIDLFFVLSSYLITSIAFNEWDKTDRIDLVAYAGRRVRRLLPALLVLLLFLTLYLLLYKDELNVSRWTASIVAALTYSANWYEISTELSYFEDFENHTALRHVWSFSIEEQFYVFAPLFLIGVLTFAKKAPYRMILVLTVVGSLVSAWWMAHLYNGENLNRVYYGTDTRAQALLVGMALAALVRIWGPVRSKLGERALLAGAYLATAWFMWGIFRLSESTAWMFDRGGFLLAAVIAAVMVYGVAQPSAGVPQFLSAAQTPAQRGAFGVAAAALVFVVWFLADLAQGITITDHLIYLIPSMALAFAYGSSQPTADPLHWFLEHDITRWVGKISYGLYLYHWPIYLLLTPERAERLIPGVDFALGDARLVALHIVLTFVVSIISFYVIEQPVMKRTFPITLRTIRPVPGTLAAAFGIIVIFAGLLAINADDDAVAAEGTAGCAAQPLIPPPGATDELRVLIVGDSVALQIGESMCDWAVENPGEIVVMNEAHVGCVVGRGGQKIAPGEPPGEVGDICTNWGNEVSYHELVDPHIVSWPSAVEVFQPDIVVGTITPWDVTDRQVPALGDHWTWVGMPDYDQFIRDEYREATTVLGSTGAEVLWLLGPHLNRPLAPQNDPVRIDRLNQLIQEELADIDYAGFLDYPSFIGAIGSDRELALRDDGVHLTDQGREEVAPWLVGELTP